MDRVRNCCKAAGSAPAPRAPRCRRPATRARTHACQGLTHRPHERGLSVPVCETRPRCAHAAHALATAVASVGATLLLPSPAQASIGGAVANTLTSIAPDWVVVLTMAALPVLELRGAIPVGIGVLGMDPFLVLLLAVAGNTLPVPLIMLSLTPISRVVSKVGPLQALLQKLLERAEAQAKSWGEDSTFWGLVAFVGVPLPGTGAWSGAIVSWVLKLSVRDAVYANFLGVCIAGVLVTALSCMGWTGFWLAIIAIITIPLISFLIRSMSNDPR